MKAILDLGRVLWEPGEVFSGMKEKPRILLPLLSIMVILMVVTFVQRPFIVRVLEIAMADLPEGAASIAPELQATIQAIVGPLFIGLWLAIAALVLWILVSVLGGEGKYKSLYSIAVYSFPPQLIYGIIALVILNMRGVESVSTQLDLQPSLGLDLVFGNVEGFIAAFLRGINPFTIWGVVLTAIGIEKVLGTEKGTAYTASIAAALLGLAIGAALSGLAG